MFLNPSLNVYQHHNILRWAYLLSGAFGGEIMSYNLMLYVETLKVVEVVPHIDLPV